MKKEKIVVIGSGYVGLVTGVGFASKGFPTICLDIDERKIEKLRQGIAPFYEPGLQEMVEKTLKAGTLQFTSSYREALTDCLFCFLALPTPPLADLSCDISYLLQAARSVASVVESTEDPLILINKSTVPVGTAEKVTQEIEKVLSFRNIKKDIIVVSNPEFLKEGSALSDCLFPSRILIGAKTPTEAHLLSKLYTAFCPEVPQLIVDTSSAELAKYAANAMLATRLSFINDLAILCQKLGADIKAVQKAIGLDPRIGTHYLAPGIGFGGSCLPKDVCALRAMAAEVDHPTPLLDAVWQINQKQSLFFLRQLEIALKTWEGKTICILGLSFKPDTDDLREAPSIGIINHLLSKGASVRLYDPVSIEKAKKEFSPNSSITYCNNPYEAAQEANAILLLTEWKEFCHLDFAKLGAVVQDKLFFDGRLIYDREELARFGFTLYYIGQKIPISPVLDPLPL